MYKSKKLFKYSKNKCTIKLILSSNDAQKHTTCARISNNTISLQFNFSNKKNGSEFIEVYLVTNIY